MRYILILLIVSILSCKTKPKTESFPYADAEPRNLSEDFKSYWFSGKAELTSYDLEFYRYGEKRTGKAMMIFVTEDFLKEEQVKANQATEKTITVMKLNSTKKFNTGIYPYSIMQSAFVPLENKMPIIKIAASVQEWCGQVYAQLNLRNNFDIKLHSYFEGEADSELEIQPTLTENELWVQLRVNPKQIELGQQEVLPDFSYLRLSHKDFKSYSANLKQSEGEYLKTSLIYEDLGRTLNIYQEKTFPFSIEKWEEIEVNSKDTLVSKATKINTLKTKYWQQNSNKYLHLRDSLGL